MAGDRFGRPNVTIVNNILTTCQNMKKINK